MTTRRQWSGKAWVLVCALCASAACGGDEESDIFAPGTFAGMHEAEIVYACQQTVLCMSARMMDLPPDPERNCQQTTVDWLESSPGDQTPFLNNYANCQNLTNCDYYRCSESGAVSFGRSQMMNVMYACQQHVDCEVMNGRLGNDPMAVSSCVNDIVGQLDTMTSTAQGQFADSFQTCRTLMSCEFASCLLWPGQ